MNKREYWLEKGYTEEQVTEILNGFHESSKGLQKELADIKAQNVTYANDNATMKTRLEEIDKANMSEQEKLEQMKKETLKNLSDSKKILNSAKAKEILTETGISGEELDKVVNSIVSEDEKLTIENATNIATIYKNIKEQTVKKTKEDLLNMNLKPNYSNKDSNNGIMTKEEFNKLSYNEQKKLKDERPEEYRAIMEK